MAQVRGNALPFFAELREARPILRTPVATLVSRFGDVEEILHREAVFSVSPYLPRMTGVIGPFVLSRDLVPGYDHDSSVARLVVRREDPARVANIVSRHAGAIVDDLFRGGGPVEIVQTLTRRVPVPARTAGLPRPAGGVISGCHEAPPRHSRYWPAAVRSIHWRTEVRQRVRAFVAAILEEEAWCARSLAGEDIVRPIRDGTVAKARIDREATAISVFAAIGGRRDAIRAPTRRSRCTTGSSGTAATWSSGAPNRGPRTPCQRRTQVFDSPVRRMISTVPTGGSDRSAKR